MTNWLLTPKKIDIDIKKCRYCRYLVILELKLTLYPQMTITIYLNASIRIGAERHIIILKLIVGYINQF
jgi:hypothetical protein